MSGLREGRGVGPMGRAPGGDTPLPDAPTPPTVADVVERVITRFDGDDDDSVTLEELLALLDPEGTHTTVGERATAAFTQLDADASGKVDRAELTTAVGALDSDGDGLVGRDERAGDDDAIGLLLHHPGPMHGGSHGGGPGPHGDGGATVDALVARILVHVDADDSGTIGLSELVAALDAHGHSTAQAESDAAALLVLLDTDSDQSIGRDELAAALVAADTDGDALVEWSEFVALPDDYVLLLGLPHDPHDG